MAEFATTFIITGIKRRRTNGTAQWGIEKEQAVGNRERTGSGEIANGTAQWGNRERTGSGGIEKEQAVGNRERTGSGEIEKEQAAGK